MRGLEKEDTPITRGFQIYYNFIKPHQALNGKTPARKAKVSPKLEQNKWLSFIRKTNGKA